MLIAVRNIKLTCELHKAIKLNYKNTRTRVIVVLRLPSTLRRPLLVCYLVTSELRKLPALPYLGRAGALDKYDVTDGVQYVYTPRSPHISMAIISVTVQTIISVTVQLWI